MLRTLSTAATGMDAQQTRLDVTANNIANVSTPGFKKSRAEFQDLMYQTIQEPGAATGVQFAHSTNLRRISPAQPARIITASSSEREPSSKPIPVAMMSL